MTNIIYQASARDKKIQIYRLNPTICKGCKCCLLFEFRKNKFCTMSCGAKFNNRKRKPTIAKTKQLACAVCKTINNVSGHCSSYKCDNCKNRRLIPYSRFSYCTVCNVVIPFKHTQTCSKACLSKHLSSIAIKQTRRRLMRYSKEYNGTLFDSSYEVAVAKSLDKHYVKWIRPEPLQYIDSTNKVRHYYPDFYLPEFDVYLDPKNDYLIKTQCDKIRSAASHNNVKIIILSSLQLEWDSIRPLLSTN